MPRVEAPLIDPRTYGDLVAEVEELMQQYTAGSVAPSAEMLAGAILDQAVAVPGSVVPSGTLVTPALAQQIAAVEGIGLVRVKGWQKPAPGAEDAGWALARIFGRMAELVVTRLNRLPDRNFLAFLDLIGTRLNPPQPARVPLTFQLATGSPVDTLVPAGTQAAAAALEGEAEPPLFETERDLVVTRSQLAAVYTREPGRDLWADHTAAAGQGNLFWPFRGDRRMEHRLHVSELTLYALPEEKTLDLLITPADAAQPWLSAVTWSWWNGLAYQPLTPTVTFQAGSPATWRVRFANLPGIPASAVNGIGAPWLHARLETGLPRGASGEVVQAGPEQELWRRGARPAALLTETAGILEAVDLDATFLPFGDEPPTSTFYVSTGTDFVKPKSTIRIEVLLDPARPPAPTSNLAVTWEYWSNSTWKTLTGATFTPAVPPAAGQVAGLFLVDGALRFPKPDDWTLSQVKGISGSWLRARVTAGSFGTPPNYRPPRVESLTLGDDWRLPRVDSLRTAVTIDRRTAALQKVPERGFTNQTPLDLSKDFLPFGDKPRVGDAFYLAGAEAFSKPLAQVELNVALTDPAAMPAPDSTTAMLTWEYWDGRAWRFLGNTGPGATNDDKANNPAQGFTDGTNGFLAAGVVRFTVPSSGFAPAEINGEVRRWVRARLAKGHYGVEARYNPVVVNGQTQYQLVPATFKPPSLAALKLGYLYDSGSTIAQFVLAENDAVFADVSNPAAGAGDFTPFVPSADRRPALYLGFERPGDAVGFANRATALFFQVSESLYDPAVEQGRVTEEASIVWEYWNGEAWERLGTRDETRGFTRRGLVTFIGPPDFRASTELGRTAFWLRGRWDRGDYALEPLLDRVLTNTTWAVHARTVFDEVLGSSRGERGQVYRTLRAPVLDGQTLEVIEPEVPSGDDLAGLEAEEGDGALSRPVTVVRDAQGQFAEVRVRWHEVPDFYGSGPRSRHYVLDHGTGEVRFGDGRRGLVPPPGRNNVRMVRYQAGGGLAGNRPAGSIAQLKGTVPYVDGVVQHVAAEGGAPEEALEAVRARGPKVLRHRDRATAAADYEDLAFQASTQVARARALPARKSPEAGEVGLIVVPAVPAGIDKPVPGLELLTRVRSFIEERLPPVVDFWVVGPDWLQVDVRAEIVPLRLEAANDVHTAVLERLRLFLHPLRGGPDWEGWDFGRKPHRSDLYALIEETPGVDHVRRLEVTETPREGGARPGRFLVFSGNHEIALSGNTDDDVSGSQP
jgi:hypothetical protein